MSKTNSIKMYKLKGKGLTGEYFFLNGLKVVIQSSENPSNNRTTWHFDISCTRKSKFQEALSEVNYVSGTFYNKDTCVSAAVKRAKLLAKKALKNFDLPLKAFMSYDEDNYVDIVYSVNAILAKREIAQMRCQRFIDVRVRRCPWADGYKSAEKIPPKVWLENGFAAPCSKCSEYFYDGDLVQIGDEYFCKSCSQNRQ